MDTPAVGEALPLRGPPQRKALHVGASGGVGTLPSLVCAEFSLRINLTFEPVIGSVTCCLGVLKRISFRAKRESSNTCRDGAAF